MTRGVLIPNMEMPKDCMSCPFLSVDGCAVVDGIEFNMEDGWRRADCPLVPATDFSAEDKERLAENATGIEIGSHYYAKVY